MINIKNYFSDNRLKITIIENKISILNFLKILTLSENEIIIKTEINEIIIGGKKLSVLKLFADEILIGGNISKLEFRC